MGLPQYYAQTGTGSTAWNVVNWHVSPINIGFGVVVTGAVTYSIQHTFDDPNNLPSGVSSPQAFNHPLMANQTTTMDGSYTFPIVAYRLNVSAGTGTARFSTLQAGIEG